MNQELNHPYSQTAKVLEEKQGQTILQFENGQKINWPSNLLPKGAKLGTEIKIIVHDQQTDEEERQRLARTLLNEIIKEQ